MSIVESVEKHIYLPRFHYEIHGKKKKYEIIAGGKQTNRELYLLLEGDNIFNKFELSIRAAEEIIINKDSGYTEFYDVEACIFGNVTLFEEHKFNPPLPIECHYRFNDGLLSEIIARNDKSYNIKPLRGWFLTQELFRQLISYKHTCESISKSIKPLAEIPYDSVREMLKK